MISNNTIDKLLSQLKSQGVQTSALKSVGIKSGSAKDFKANQDNTYVFNQQVFELHKMLYQDTGFTKPRSKEEVRNVIKEKLQQSEYQKQPITTKQKQQLPSLSSDQSLEQSQGVEEMKYTKPEKTKRLEQLEWKGEHLLLDDYRILSKIPTLKIVKQNLNNGKITQPEYVRQSAEILSDASKSNKTVSALINQVVEEKIHKVNVTKQNVVDANTYEEIDTSSRKTEQQQQQVETKFSKPRTEQSGISTENKRVGAILPTDLTRLQDTQSNNKGKLTAQIANFLNDTTTPDLQTDQASLKKISDLLNLIQTQHPTSQQIQQRLQAIHKKATGRDLQLLQQNEVSLNKSVDDIENVRDDESIDPLYQEPPKSAIDIVSDLTYKSMVASEIDKQNLTEPQRQLAQNVLLDMDGLINNLDMISDASSKVGKHQKSIVQKFSQLSIQGSDGKSYDVKQLLNSIPKIVKMISDIQGSIDPTNTKLQDYKRTTQIFSTAIVKKETNQFKTRQGQAFMTRACC